MTKECLGVGTGREIFGVILRWVGVFVGVYMYLSKVTASLAFCTSPSLVYTDRSDCCSAHHHRWGDICQSNVGARVGCHPHLSAGQQTETQESPKATFDCLTSRLLPSLNFKLS